MKVYISADIEGVTGIAHWDEASKAHADYSPYQEQMIEEVAAVCRGAVAAGAKEILVKDAHATARNLDHRRLPREVRMVRGWAGHPLCMVQELDESFDAVMMIGYHSAAGSGANPLAHTLTSRLALVELNGVRATEFLLHAHAAETFGVPVVLVSGDEALGSHVRETQPAITTVASGRGVGSSTVSRHPAAVVEDLEAAAATSLAGDLSLRRVKPADRYALRLRYKDMREAYRASQYPGMRVIDDGTIEFETAEYFEVMRALLFVS